MSGYDEYEPGVRCWLPNDAEGWVGATIESKDATDDNIKLVLKLDSETEFVYEATSAEIKSGKKPLPPLRNPPILESTEDLTTLSYLNEPAVLHAIKARYSQLSIYTFSGIVLIATNPFDRVDNLYTPEVIQTYSGRQRGELEPHLFSIAEDAYRCMIRDKRNQTIVVSGESGAGKTVSAKYIMRYFATVEDPDHPRKRTSGEGAADLSTVEKEILATNPIMEAFGNAKTTRNDNSSRFGKYLEIHFSPELEIIGARIRTYLLERSRIVFHPATERNYHIFYQLVRGTSDEEKKLWGLEGGVNEFHYLNQGDPDIAGIDDAEDFAATREALSVVDVAPETQSSIFQILAALLHLGNVAIKGRSNSVVVASDDPALVKATELLGISAPDLARWLMKKQISMRSEKIISDLDAKAALVVRDSIAKYVYSTLFDWLVSTVNRKLLANNENSASFIGVLDIYGFEHFKTNSFEQFCINYANEKLQQEFNQHVFKLEQEEYQTEEIDWTYIDFSDNQPCIDLIENRQGVLGLLDEESRLPAGSDDGFVQKLYSNFDRPEQKHFKKPRFGQSAFVVRHYAMDVSYETEGFIEKNRDSVPDQIVDVLQATTNPFLKQVFDEANAAAAAAVEKEQAAAAAAATNRPGSRGAAKPRKPTLGNIFKTSLIDLMSTINSTNAHYIRCIKPNEEKQAWKFSGPMVLAQLRACGVLETIRISSAGFPSRWPYAEFAERYEMLLNSSQRNSSDANAICSAIIKHTITDTDKYQLGKTKIFFRAGMLAYLEKKRSDRISEAAIHIQRMLRGKHYRKKFVETMASIQALQNISRGFTARIRAKDLRENFAATRIQAHVRGFKHRKNFNETRDSVIALQALARGLSIRNNLYENQRREAITLIQSAARGFQARERFQKDSRLVKLIQSMIRRKAARAELGRLREERRSVKHFEEAQYRLENKVISLQNFVSQYKQDNQSLNETLETLRAEHAQLNTTHTEAVAAHQRSLDEQSQLYETTNTKLSELTTAHETASKELEQAQSQVESLQSELSARDQQIGGLNERIEELEKQLEESREALKHAEATIDSGPRHMMINGPSHTHHSATPSRDLNGHPSSFEPQLYSEPVADDNEINMAIEQMLKESPGAREELLMKLIRNLVVPTPKANENLKSRDVLFPANMANLMISEMWRLGYVEESEKLIGAVLKMIQETVQKFSGEKIIPVGAFWMSNVHEIYSFFCLAEVNILQNPQLQHEMTQVELSQYQRLMSLAKRDAEAVTFNVYHIWMKEIKKIVDKMIIPAMVEEQSIPGFHVEEQPRFLSRVFQTSPEYKMNDLLLLLTKIHNSMKVFFLEERYIRQPIMELLNMIGSKAFNDMIMRKNFLSWKRSVQINYNVTRIAEWCKTNGLPEGGLPLDRVMQGAKLLQLKKNVDLDVSIIYDICWALTPVQIQRLVSSYQVADYEQPISQATLQYLAERVKEDKSGSTQLMLDMRSLTDSGPFEVIAPRVLRKIEPYLPSDLDVPKLRLLTELTTRASRSLEADLDNKLEYEVDESVTDEHVGESADEHYAAETAQE